MKLVLSVPTGYHAREMLLPLYQLMADDFAISAVNLITPAASHAAVIFPHLKDKFHFWLNRDSVEDNIDLLSEIKPDIVVTPTIGLDVLDIPILHAAKRLHLPSLTFVASWDNVFKMARLFKRGHSGSDKRYGQSYVIPDHLAVWNQFMVDHLRTIMPSFSVDHIHITGPPRFDYFTHTASIPAKQQLLDYIGFPAGTDNRPLIHLATTELYPFVYIAKAIHEALNGQEIKQSLNLYASVHPGGNIKNHESLAQYGAIVKYSFGRREPSPLPSFAYLPTEEEIYYLIALFKHTSILINQSSTVAIESMFADVPVINIKYGRPFDWLRWRRSMVYRDFQQHYKYITAGGATTLVQNKKQLIKAINRYLAQPTLHQANRQQTLLKLITYPDGQCRQRLLRVIKQAAQQEQF